jgi:DNA repair protein RecO (recombination protein O)
MRISLVSPAIVLRVRPFGESDKIVFFLTEKYGKMSGIAKGAMRSRKRFVNSLEPFSHIKLSFQDRPHSSLAFLLNAELIHGSRALIADLDRIAQASYLVEITEGLIAEREENQAVFQHLRDGLCHLANKGASLRFLTAFELKLLALAGYQPALDHCKRCQKHCNDSVQWYFSMPDGGIVCNNCSQACHDLLPLGKTAVEILTALQSDNNSLPVQISLAETVVAEMRGTLLQFIQFHLGHEIKSAPFLNNFRPVKSLV